jgi:uncharacterized membrane protein YhaH (DUF805 family)
MSKPIFSDLFTFSGRRNRQSFILFQLASLAAVLLGLGVITAITIAAPAVGTVLWVVGIAGFIAIAVANWAAASQRVRDFGQSGVWSLVMLIPYVGPVFSIALWIIPSTPGENKYGPSQTEAQLVTA